jgi:chromosome segregation ATPase
MQYFVTKQEMREKLSEVSKAHEKELADMNAANAALTAQLEKAPADVKDLQQQTVDKLAARLAAAEAELEAKKGQCISLQSALNNVTEELEAVRRKVSKAETKSAEDSRRQTVDRQAETAVLKEELSGLENKTRELIKNEDKLRKQSSAMQALLEASNAETAAVKAALSTLEKQLKEMHEEDSKKAGKMAMDNDQIEQLKARVAFLDRELQGAALVIKHELIC